MMRTLARTVAVALLLVLTFAEPTPPPASAATVTVTDCGDSGLPGQLRVLIASAMPGDTIMVPACTIHLLAASPLIITQDVTIQGAGAQKTILDGGGATRVFHLTAGNVAIRDVTIRNGHPASGDGGGILLEGTGALSIANTIVSGNTAPRFGGGIANESGLANLGVESSTVSGNVAQGDGGGGIDNLGILTLINSTVSGNSTSASSAHAAGGLAMVGAGAVALLLSDTISGNTGPNAGLSVTNNAQLQVKNTIIANNTPANCRVAAGGALQSRGHNIESMDTCMFDRTVHDLSLTDPMLGPLQLNGGPTPTQALLPGSPAIDAGDSDFECQPTDQRGVPRQLDAESPGFTVCDIGAFEVETLAFIPMSLGLNTPTVHPGTPLQGTVTVANDGAARPLDVYVFFVPPAGVALGCPNGDPVVFLTLSGAALTCVSSGVQAFTPLLSNATLSGDLFTPIALPVFSLAWPAAPTGAWLAGIALTPVGAFSDGRVNPFADLVLATAGFTATP